jgi:hypothetical protein
MACATIPMARPRRRSPSSQRWRDNQFFLFDGNIALGWRVTRRVSHQDGERMVATGHARPVNDHNGVHIGYQMQQPAPVKNGVPAKPTPALLSAKEMDLIAGQAFAGGQSRTFGRSEVMRLTRTNPWTGKLLPPEDEVERALAKLRAVTPRHLQALHAADALRA